MQELIKRIIVLWLTVLSLGILTISATAEHEEIVEGLRELGIEVSDETVQETEDILRRWELRWGIQPDDFALTLLSILGEGEESYDSDEHVWIWSPSSSSVYSFDAEVTDYTNMYKLFLQGIASIVPSFEATDIQENIRAWTPLECKVNMWLHGNTLAEGITTVSFSVNGHRYERSMDSLGDWFNDEAIGWINEVLAAEGFDGQILAFLDNGQGLILFYGDQILGERLKELIPGLYYYRDDYLQ